MAVSNKDFIGLEVVSLDDATVLGRVSGLIIDDGARCVAALVVDTGAYRLQVLPYSAVRSVGPDAVVIGSNTDVVLVTKLPSVEELVHRDVELPGCIVLTDDGRMLGVIDHLVIDETSGRIAQLAIHSGEEDGSILTIDADRLVTVGPDIAIVRASEQDGLPPPLSHSVRDSDLLGLQIIALDRAEVVGEVGALIFDDEEPAVAGFLADLGLYEPRVLPRQRIKTIGPDAILVDSADSLCLLSQNKQLEQLASRRFSLTGARAVTVSGRSAGVILHSYVDTRDASLLGLEFLPASARGRTEQAELLPLSCVVRRGKHLVVVQDDYQAHLEQIASVPDRAPAPSEPEDATVASPAGKDFLLGKKVSRRLELPTGELVADVGEQVTPELIRKAREHNLLLVLSLNVD